MEMLLCEFHRKQGSFGPAPLLEFIQLELLTKMAIPGKFTIQPAYGGKEKEPHTLTH
jgi:hypothetical protein